MDYQPKFTIDNEILTLVSDISVLIGRIHDDDILSRDLKLRRENRIRSIHSSLGIEGNTLSLEKITDIIDGKHVVGSAREILEVKGAMAAYDAIDSLDPYSVDDVLKAHDIMMKALVKRSGKFRDCSVGVFKGPVAVHIAPEAEDVPAMMEDLLNWAKSTDQHPLIKGCVFHCRFEFIHPFVDGNGRMGRLWHSLILSNWNPIFAHLPVETWVRSNQQEYYAALNDSDKGDLTEFIRFMLNMIKMAVDEFVDIIANDQKVSEIEGKILKIISKNPEATALFIAEELNVSDRTVKRHLSKLTEKGFVKRTGSDKTGRWEIV
jgi:Uncharacterized conserved protein